MFKTLSTRELSRFEMYIHSPFFNKNEAVFALFHLIKKNSPDYTAKQLKKEEACKVLFSKEKPDLPRLRYVMTDLTRLLEDYLAYLQYEVHEVYQRHLMLSALSIRHLDKYFSGTYDLARSELEKGSERDVEYYFDKYLIEENAYLHSLSRESQDLGTPLQQAVDNLDLYYLAQKLRYCCVIFNREAIFQVKYNTMLLPEILEFLKEKDFDHVPAVSIYYQIIMTFMEPEEEKHYHQLKKLLTTNTALFQRTEIKDMYVFALNYCIKKLNSGNLEYLQELFSHYQHLVEKDILLENAHLAPADFKNIVTIALRSGQTEWTENFIEKYKNKLPSEAQEHTHAYSKAFIHYYRKEFSKALRLLQTVEFTDVYYHLDAKALLLRTYYELFDTEPFFSMADAFTNYLKRNKLISSYQRTVYLNFVKFIRKLLLLRLGGRGSVNDLLEALKKSPPVASLQWLIAKTEELQKEEKKQS
ncbi:MAG: hypothetical protein M3Q97_05500 [Bacteroidota bacterium]|nr:hypothetical protein [Bacteroidota bacterium]